MSKYDIVKKIKNRELTRRQMLKAAAAAGVVATTMPMQSMAQGSVNHFTWGGYDDPGMAGSFIEKHGEEALKFSIFGDTEEAFMKMRGGYVPDTMHPCYSDIIRWARADLLHPFDTTRLSNWGDLYTDLKYMPMVRWGGNVWFAPIDWGDTSICYRTDLVTKNTDSWGMLWDKKLKGKIAVLDSAEDAWYATAIYMGMDIGRMQDFTVEDVTKVYDKMREQRSLVRLYSSDMTTLAQALASGEVVAAMTWNETQWAVNSEETPTAFMSPKEGTLTWVCGASIHKDAPNLDLAYDLVDALISYDTGLYLVGEWGYGHSNQKAFESFSADDLAERGLASDPMAHLAKGKFGNQPPDEIHNAVQQGWEEMISGF